LNTSEPEVVSSTRYPKWLRDIRQLLPIRSQYVVTGNIRDQIPATAGDGSLILKTIQRMIADSLAEAGVDVVLRWDLISGLELIAGEEHQQRLSAITEQQGNGPWSVSIVELGQLLRRISVLPASAQNLRVAIMIDFASRLPDEGRFLAEVKMLYQLSEKAAIDAVPVGFAEAGKVRMAFNPVIWLVNREADVPYWFNADNDRVHILTVPEPDSDVRALTANHLYRLFPQEYRDVAPEVFARELSNLTHGMSINALQDVVTLATQIPLPASQIDDAVECYRVGDLSMESPWRANALRESIRSGLEALEDRVKGQRKAVTKVLDVLKRTSIGLTGAQTRSVGSRPKGVLFFVGPTGVGKTELAKAITKLVFGNESAYVRFDMSEFAAEHSADRLIGAPPGYVGFDQGGELTNTMRENPYRVLLFDEIEKAHPRILDKFLQILEDGRLTDGRGETVFFGDALIIFTSNAGVSQRLPNGQVEYLVSADDPPDEFESLILSGVKSYFHNELRRPELFNRIGENFVVFNFISPDVAKLILDGMVENVVARVRDELELALKLSAEAESVLLLACTQDLSNGGRGIGSKLEDTLINPLARALFDLEFKAGQVAHVTDISESDGIYSLSCEIRPQQAP
jgi:ATP-dependent Clp protease ATP-binding subunit ClpB